MGRIDRLIVCVILFKDRAAGIIPISRGKRLGKLPTLWMNFSG
jgi:hypothetical protein